MKDKLTIPKSVSKHLFLSNLKPQKIDDKLYTKFKFIRAKKNLEEFKENQNI